jgi:hypothetical protein
MIMAKPGAMISGDDVAALIKESQETGIPMAKLVSRLENVQSSVQILPGDGVPEAAPRSKGRNRKKKSKAE